MSNKKISQLTEVTTPTTTDVFPVVNAGTTKKAQLGNLPISTATQTALDAKEATANKSTDVVTDQASNTKYPSVKSVYDWVVGLLTGKQDTLVSGTNIKTVNSTSLLGSGDISITASAAWGGITGTLSNQTDLQNALNGKQIIPYIQSNQASPVIHASDDVNTGINWTLADTLDLVAGGSSKVRINQTGVTNITVNNSTYVSGTELGYLDGVTSAIQTQIDGKQATLVSGTNIKTINSTSLLGSGDIAIDVDLSPISVDGDKVSIAADSTVTTQTTAVIQSSTTNSGIAIVPNGTGAITVSIPDGTATGGNARGAYSVDLQTYRFAADQVASNNRSFVAGTENKSTGNASVVIGLRNNDIGSASSILLGASNTSTNTSSIYNNVALGGGNTLNERGNIAIGRQNIVNGIDGVAIGSGNTSSRESFVAGLNNVASANHSTISGGESNTASTNTHATVVGGQGNTSSGAHSVSGGKSNNASGTESVSFGESNVSNNRGSVSLGRSNTASGLGSFAVGFGNSATSNYASAFGLQNTAGQITTTTIGMRGKSYLFSQFSHASNQFSTKGDAQSSIVVARKSDTLTAGASTVLDLDGTGSTQLIIPDGNNRVWNVTVKTVAVVTAIVGTATGVTVGDVFMENKSILFKKISGVSSVVDLATDNTFADGLMDTSSMAYTAGASQELALTYTGPTFAGGGSVTVRVVSKVELVEVAY